MLLERIAVLGLSFISWLCNAIIGREHSISDYAKCSAHDFKVKIFSIDPTILYLVDFLAEDEVLHLMEISSRNLTDSQRVDLENGIAGGVDKNFRSSKTAFISPDHVTSCIEQRALQLQGHLVAPKVETLQVVQYARQDYVRNHFDWFEEDTVERLKLAGRRDTTIFGYVYANCTGGGTNFPRIKRPGGMDKSWCEYVDCEQDPEAGVTFQAISRNAVFWQNWNTDGSPRRDLLHNGQPVMSGTKIGLNLWTSRGSPKAGLELHDAD